MTNIDQHHKVGRRLVYSSIFSLPNVFYGLGFGVLGALTNIFLNVSFFANISLFFGQVFVLVCLITRGLNSAIIAVMFTSVSASIYANDPYLIIIYSLELLVVNMLISRGVFLFQSAALYWLLIGLPLLALLHAITSSNNTELLLIQGITNGINGLICLSLASLVYWFLPQRLIYPKFNEQPPKLASLIFSLCMITVTLPTMLVASFFILQTTASNEQSVAKELANVSEQAVSLNNETITKHLEALSSIASIVETSKMEQLQGLLDATAKHYDLFESISLSDSNGNIIFAAPHKYALQLSKMNRPSIHNRDYFTTTRSTLKAGVSDAIVGRGFGNSYLISLTAPIQKNKDFIGIIQSSILLEHLSLLNQSKIPDGYLIVITDNKGRIISRSDSLGYLLMSNFDYSLVTNPLIPNIPVLEFNGQPYLYSQGKSDNGWQITILSAPAQVTNMVFELFFLLMLATFFMLAAFALIANRLSNKITQPLVNIAKHFPNTSNNGNIIPQSQASSEMVVLTNKLRDSHELMTNFQQKLSEQVHTKTKQLKQLNKELYSIAQKDSLTQLLNRAGFNRLALTSYRNCVRNHIPMSLIIIDIDFFKVINDTYGHPFGDKCIVAAAKTIQHHCKRDTDVLGRYGGEEFIVMISGADVNDHILRVAMIKDQIQSLSFKSGENKVRMTISAGICSLATDFSVSYEDVLKIADEQLYVSKRKGRNKISSIIK